MNSSTTGITKIIYPWEQNILISGNILNNKIVPITYKIQDLRENNKKGHMHIEYINNTPKIISAKPDPKDDTRRKTVPITLIKDSFDPVTSIIILGLLSHTNKNCDTTIPIFDGRRRFDLNYKSIEKIEHNYKCELKINRIAGYSKKELKKHPKNGTIFLTKLPGTKQFLFPSEVKIPLIIGSFFVKLNANLILP